MVIILEESKLDYLKVVDSLHINRNNITRKRCYIVTNERFINNYH